MANEEPLKLPVYVRRENCTEEEINKFIQLGYTPWQVTPVLKTITKGAHVVSETTLVYHLIKKKER